MVPAVKPGESIALKPIRWQRSVQQGFGLTRGDRKSIIFARYCDLLSTADEYSDAMISKKHPTNWRDYQARLQKAARVKRQVRALLFFAAVSIGVLACLGGLLLFQQWLVSDSDSKTEKGSTRSAGAYLPPAISRQALPELLGHWSPQTDSRMVLERRGRSLTVSTTIDSKLQKYITRLVGWSKTEQAAVVVLEAHSGKILAMVSYDSTGGEANLCLKAEYPAASLFKIVSAAAALETAGYTPETPLHFNGRRHTLYKNQLADTRNRWSTKTKFRKAFAVSNNVVFGKIGIHDLGARVISEFAGKFFFNRPIPFDLPLSVSKFAVPDDDFALAEIASGFNKKTLLSPLHAAMLATAAANQGRMAAPWLVETISDAKGSLVYRARQPYLEPSIRSQTARDLKLLMEDTVRYGTSRGAFRKLRRQRMFRDFSLGAKTGTINDRNDRFKFDWLTAFSLPPDKSEGICVGILAVHGKYLGTRATEMARAIIHYHYHS